MSKSPNLDHSDVFELSGIRLVRGDAVALIKELEDSSIDLAIVDPPYSASTKNPAVLPEGHSSLGFGGKWKAANHKWDFIDPSNHLEWVAEWLKELNRVVKPEGSIWIHGSYHNLGFVNVACQMLGMEIINEVIWFKRNAMPNLRASRLTASHESIYWVHTGGKKRKYLFNYLQVKEVSYQGDHIKQAGKQLRTVWDIPNNKTRYELSQGSHPTQKPERLIQRLLDVSAPKNGKVLSLFAGSGTDLVIAMRNGLDAIGFELEEEYFELAKKRLIAEAHQAGEQLPFENQDD